MKRKSLLLVVGLLVGLITASIATTPSAMAQEKKKDPLVMTGDDVFAAFYALLVSKAQTEYFSKNGQYASDVGALGAFKTDFDANAFTESVKRVQCTITALGANYKVVTFAHTNNVGGNLNAPHFMMQNGTDSIYMRAGGNALLGDPTQADEMLTWTYGKITARKDWQSLPLTTQKGEMVHALAVGSWKVGATWKATGAGGSEETSRLGDLRFHKSDDLLVGGLIMRMEGSDVISGAKKNDSHLQLLAASAGKPEFRINTTSKTASGDLFVVAVTRAQ